MAMSKRTARSLFIAIPCHSSIIPVGTAISLLQTAADLQTLGLTTQTVFWGGDSIVTHARNLLVAKFMASECTDMICIDSDIAWRTEDMVKLNKHKAYLVCRAYRYKSDPEDSPWRPLPHSGFMIDAETGKQVHDGGVIEVEHMPMGFARLSRSCLERMIEAYKNMPYT